MRGSGVRILFAHHFYRSYGLFQSSGTPMCPKGQLFGSPGHEIGCEQIESLTATRRFDYQAPPR